MLGNNVVAEFHALNALAPMDDYFAEWSSDAGADVTKDIWPGDELYYHLDGHWWGSPIAEETRCLYYRKDLFTKAGLDPATPPATWDDAQSYAQKLTTSDVWGFGIPGGIKYATVQTFMSVYLSYGATFLNANGQCGFDTPEFRQALTYYTDLYTKYKVTPPDTPTYDNTQLEPLFLKGSLAMYIDGPWLWTMIQDQKPAFMDQVAVAEVPGGPKGRFGFLGGWPLVLWSASEHKDESFKWIRFATDPKGYLPTLVKAAGQLPGRKSAVDQDPWNSAPLDVFAKQLGFAYPYQYPAQEIKQMGTLEVDAIQTPVQEVMLNTKTVDQATKDMVTHINQVLSS